ncbi:MAG: Uncharacterised protein [Cyanobium sp. ARS6]|nr:MAG: Uncharacterised protein [Cyanobium sp. ARS6]
MGVPAEQGVRSCGFNTFKCCKGVHVWKQVFVLTVGAAVHKQQPVSAEGHGQTRQESLVGICDALSSPVVSTVTTTLGQLRWVTAFAGVESVDDVFIPAALTGGNGAFTHQFNDFIGLWAVAHQITQAGDGVDALSVDVSQHRFAGCEVGVQTGDHCVAHGYLLD